MNDKGREKVRAALREAILSLCNHALDFTMELSIEGLLGVTIDKQDVFLVNVNEIARGPDYEEAPEEQASPNEADQKVASRGMSKRSYMKQLVKRRSAMRKAATIAKVKTWKMTEKLKESEKTDLLQESKETELLRELSPEVPTKKSELVTLAMLKGAPPKKRIREASFSEEHNTGIASSRAKRNDKEDEDVKGEEEAVNRDWIPPDDQNQVHNSTDLPLPDPMTSPDKAEMIRMMNEVVGYNFMKKKELRRKRGEYNNYSSEVRLRIGQYAAEHGIPATLRHFKKEFGRPVSDSTVRSLRRAYVSAMDKNKNDTDDIKELPKKDRGRPLKLKEYDQEVLDYIDNIRRNGGTINVQIVMDAARGVLLHKAKHKLKEFGGKIEITKGWADSFIRRMKHAGYLPEHKASKKEDNKPEEVSVETAVAGDQGNHGNVSETQPRAAVVTPALSDQSYGSSAAVEPLSHEALEYVNSATFQQHLQQQQQQQEQMSSSPVHRHHHPHHQHHHPGVPTASPHQERSLHNLTTSDLPPPPSIQLPSTHNSSIPHTSLQQHLQQQQQHLETQDSPRMDEQDFINHTPQPPQISPRFSQSQLSPRDYSQSANSYLNSHFAHLRPPPPPPSLESVQGSTSFLGHRSLEHLSDAAGYMGALIHASRGELLPTQGRDDLEHHSEADNGVGNYVGPSGGRIEQHGYIGHVLPPPSGRNPSQQM